MKLRNLILSPIKRPQLSCGRPQIFTLVAKVPQSSRNIRLVSVGILQPLQEKLALSPYTEDPEM
ncbi:hypothetical protein RJ641_034282 [Dillenia turbinata]|uniref:Uncharacterized protein n=1 Tax=Dillenia turbinata TaxID=194707 RepID=A0AAN8ZDU3_9MAGN